MSVADTFVLLNNQITPFRGNEWNRIAFIRVVVHRRSASLVCRGDHAVFSFKFDRFLCGGLRNTQIKPSEPNGIVRDRPHTASYMPSM